MDMLSSTPWQKKFQLFSQVTLLIAAFSVPISTTITDLLLPLAMLFSLFTENFRKKLSKVLINPICLSLITFFLLYLIGTTYTTAPARDILHQLTKSSCLLIAALLIPTLNDQRWNRRIIDAFLLAMIIVLTLSYVKFFFVHELFHTRFNKASIFKDHIVQNYLMAFAAFIFLYRWLHQYPHRWIYAILMLASTYNVLFMSTGRSGYFIFAALLIYTLITHFRWKGLIIALFSITLLFGLAYTLSPAFKARMNSIASNLSRYKHGEHYSSVGIRIKSMENAMALYKQHPIVGHGTGSFRTAYATLPLEKTQVTGIMQVSYNSYLNVGVQLGLLGISLLIMMLSIQWYYSFQLPPDLRYIIQALLISMMLGCLANPWLSDTTELRFYALFLSVTFAAIKFKPIRVKSPDRGQVPFIP